MRPLNRALLALKSALAKREQILDETFMRLGPDGLKMLLKVDNDADWNRVYEHLVLNRGIVRKCVVQFMDFFYDLVADKGPMYLRKAFNIEDKIFDPVFEEIFDLVAVSKGALILYVNRNKRILTRSVLRGNGSSLRKNLCLDGNRYNSLWMEILEILMNSVCTRYYDEKMVDQGLMAFTTMMNTVRTQRSLRSFSKMWEYE